MEVTRLPPIKNNTASRSVIESATIEHNRGNSSRKNHEETLDLSPLYNQKPAKPKKKLSSIVHRSVAERPSKLGSRLLSTKFESKQLKQK